MNGRAMQGVSSPALWPPAHPPAQLLDRVSLICAFQRWLNAVHPPTRNTLPMPTCATISPEGPAMKLPP